MTQLKSKLKNQDKNLKDNPVNKHHENVKKKQKSKFFFLKIHGKLIFFRNYHKKKN